MDYPINDKDFEDTKIEHAEQERSGHWHLTFETGWSLLVQDKIPFEPKVGMKVRVYSRGLGSRVRGLFIEDQKIYYRTEEEDAEQAEIDMYGRDCADWLARWDRGDLVSTIEMGGLGPGYEQCIHITMAEILRHLLEKQYPAADFENPEAWKKIRSEIDAWSFTVEKIKNLGLSGAQYGAALHLAARFYLKGPRQIMSDKAVKDRHIMVSKHFPGAE